MFCFSLKFSYMVANTYRTFNISLISLHSICHATRDDLMNNANIVVEQRKIAILCVCVPRDKIK